MEHCEATSHSLIASIGHTDANHETLVLLHGSGVDETTLVPLAREIAPRAILIAVRGRIAQDGGMRWFTRITPTRFEQQSIRSRGGGVRWLHRRIHEAVRPRSVANRISWLFERRQSHFKRHVAQSRPDRTCRAAARHARA